MLIVETGRLLIRELQPGDAGFVLEILNSPGWLAYIGDRGVKNLDDAAAYINRNLNSYKTAGYGLYALELKENGKVAGMCGLLKRDYLPAIDLGYALLPSYEGKGYAREAAAAVMNFAGHRLGYSEIYAIVTPNNNRSVSLLENLGFKQKTERKEAGEHLLVFLHCFELNTTF